MYSSLFLLASVTIFAPPSYESVATFKDPFLDDRLLPLYKEEVRNSKVLLANALDAIWKMLPDPHEVRKNNHSMIAQHLVWFVTISSPKLDQREKAVNGSNGAAVKTMLEHIGLPAIPPLLEQLAITGDDFKEDRAHRQAVASCIVSIYDHGEDGREMAIAECRCVKP
jgi:hypothetical protein